MVFKIRDTVAGGATTYTVTHNLNDATAVLCGVATTWDAGPFITGQAANTITLTFTGQCPPGGGFIHCKVRT